jgi:hypothetical protein
MQLHATDSAAALYVSAIEPQDARSVTPHADVGTNKVGRRGCIRAMSTCAKNGDPIATLHMRSKADSSTPSAALSYHHTYTLKAQAASLWTTYFSQDLYRLRIG